MTRAKLSIDAAQIATIAVAFGYTAKQMAWALEPAVEGECGWLSGCHDPSDPGSPDGHCVRHEAYLKAHMPKAVV